MIKWQVPNWLKTTWKYIVLVARCYIILRAGVFIGLLGHIMYTFPHYTLHLGCTQVGTFMSRVEGETFDRWWNSLPFIIPDNNLLGLFCNIIIHTFQMLVELCIFDTLDVAITIFLWPLELLFPNIAPLIWPMTEVYILPWLTVMYSVCFLYEKYLVYKNK